MLMPCIARAPPRCSHGPTNDAREATMLLHGAMSRRRMLAMTAASGAALMSGAQGVRAQAAQKIEQLDPGLDKIISVSEPIKELGTGYGGDLGPAEGPLWWKE